MDPEIEKVLEIICAKLPAYEPDINQDWESLTLMDEDFKRQGMSIDRGVVLLKHKIEKEYAVVEVSEIYTADFDTTSNEELWGHPCVHLMALPLLIDELIETDKEILDLSFDNGLLNIKNIEVRFNPTENGSLILEHMFLSGNLGGVFKYRDIDVDTFLEQETNFDVRKFYNACGVINKRIMKETGIGDFLIFNASNEGYVRINPKYLP